MAKDKELELERHAALLEKITSVSGVGGWELKLGEDAPVWTKQTRLIHEVDEDYVPLLSNAIEFYAPEARPIIEKALEKGINQGVGWDLELPLITQKGRKIWARAIGEATYTGNQVTGLIGTFQDISQKKADEQRLQQSEELARERSEELDVTLANMKQGVSMFDADGNLMIWNDRYVEIFEKAPEEVVKGVSFKDILLSEKARGDFADDVERSIADLCSELAVGKTVARQFELQNGKIISSVHAPMPGGGWVGTHEDVTEQIRATREIEFAARHDPLTGLANRLRFNSSIADAVKNRRKHSQRPAVLLIDLDGFKLVN
ncbi:MAG: PAS-domain containing protein, partial [Rhizobiaceae bacterium]